MKQPHATLRQKYILSCITGKMTTVEICKKVKTYSYEGLRIALKRMADDGLIRQKRRGKHLVHWIPEKGNVFIA